MKKSEKTPGIKRLNVFCNFWILSNLIQKRENRQEPKTKTKKTIGKKKRKNENKWQKESKSIFFATISGFCLIWHNLTIFPAAAALEALLHVRGSGRPWSFGENFNDDPHEYTKTAFQAAEDFEMILMIANMIIFWKNKCFCGLQPVALKLLHLLQPWFSWTQTTPRWSLCTSGPTNYLQYWT